MVTDLLFKMLYTESVILEMQSVSMRLHFWDIANRDNPGAVADAWVAQLFMQELQERGQGRVDA